MPAYRFIETTTEPGLAYWASCFINGDASGMTDEEIKAADEWLASVQPSEPGRHASVSDCGESYTGRHEGLLADIADYTLIIYEQELP